MEIPKKQHYIPQFYLKGFLNNNTRNRAVLSVYYKLNEKRYESSIRDITEQKDFYTVRINKKSLQRKDCELLKCDGECVYVENDDIIITIEKWLSRFEAELAPIYRKISSTPDNSIINEIEWQLMLKMIAMLLLRTPYAKSKFEEMKKSCEFFTKLEKSTRYKLLWIMCFVPLIDVISYDLNDRSCRILKANMLGKHFITSDNPVLLWKIGNNEKVGVLTKDIKIYFPLTPYVTLLLYNTAIKGISHELVNDKTIKEINILHQRNAFRYVIGDSYFEEDR